HDKIVLVKRAHSRINQATLPVRTNLSRPRGRGETSELGGSIYRAAWSVPVLVERDARELLGNEIAGGVRSTSARLDRSRSPRVDTGLSKK
ncbi:MAG: hypothetical protein MN733_43670, partial [Nitrososphaera sp.]|nr:hypothetical protein [Nitrososphaera sp.]